MKNKISVAIVWCVTWFETPLVPLPVREGKLDRAPTAPARLKPAVRAALRGGSFGPLTSGQTGRGYSRLAWT